MRLTPAPALAPAALLAGLLTAAAPSAGELPDPRADLAAFLRQAMAAVCTAEDLGAEAVGWRLGEAFLLEEKSFAAQGRSGRWQRRYQLAAGDELRLVRHFPGGRLRRFSLDFYEAGPGRAPRPQITAIAGGDCAIFTGRRLLYDDQGRQAWLEPLGPDLGTTGEREPMNPPLPSGSPSPEAAVRVALFDSGVNYLLPEVAARMVYDAEGRALGEDFWELDNRPFDAHPVVSPFFPLRHGTPVASLLLREAPAALVVPFRYPRPDMGRMAAMVEAAEAAGARIVSMPMGSNKRGDWTAFAEAAAARPDMLFVISAGNNGRDIDVEPVFPAALGLDNLLVVTSSDDFGRLAPESNRGSENVDLMVPGEGQEVTDFWGAAGRGSGSSYAVPRVAALAARLLAANPDWRAPELKAAILARAAPSPYHDESVVRHGWIPDPARD